LHSLSNNQLVLLVVERVVPQAVRLVLVLVQQPVRQLLV
jgi:hypothetical protein